MAEKYFVFSCSEDGDISVSVLSRKDVEQMIDDPDYGADIEYAPCMSEADVRGQHDLMYWGPACLIIKGKVVVPKAAEKVKTWEIE